MLPSRERNWVKDTWTLSAFFLITACESTITSKLKFFKKKKIVECLTHSRCSVNVTFLPYSSISSI